MVRAPVPDSHLPGGGVQLCAVVGHGPGEDRAAAPPVLDPVGFSVAWLRGQAGQGVSAHRLDRAQVLLVRSGRWEVAVGPDTVALEPLDLFSVPAGSRRLLRCLQDGELAVMTGGGGRARPDWDADVASAAARQGWALDADGYVARRELLRSDT